MTATAEAAIANPTAVATYRHACDFAATGLVIGGDECGLPMLERIHQAAMDYLHAKAVQLAEANTATPGFPLEVKGDDRIRAAMTAAERHDAASTFPRERQAKPARKAELREALATCSDAQLVAELRDYFNAERANGGYILRSYVAAALRLLRQAR